MYLCDDCGNEFAEPLKYKEYQGECHGVPAWEEFYVCPFCKGAYHEETDEETGEQEE